MFYNLHYFKAIYAFLLTASIILFNGSYTSAGDIDKIEDLKFDIILANINRVRCQTADRSGEPEAEKAPIWLLEERE